MTNWPKWVPVLTPADMSLKWHGPGGKMSLDQWHNEVFLPCMSPAYFAAWNKIRNVAGYAGRSMLPLLREGLFSSKEQARIWNKAMRALGYTRVVNGAWDG